jgi:hypothetical protein
MLHGPGGGFSKEPPGRRRQNFFDNVLKKIKNKNKT